MGQTSVRRAQSLWLLSETNHYRGLMRFPVYGVDFEAAGITQR